MALGLIKIAAVLSTAVVAQEGVYVVFLGEPTDPKTRLSYVMTDDKLVEPKLSPKTFGDPPQPFQFEWAIRGDAKPADRFVPRFLVFSQERKATGDKGSLVVRQLLRMWDFNAIKLGVDHASVYNNGVIDVYLCWGGTAGGEQLFGEDTRTAKRPDGSETKVDVKVNTIYIYDLNSFTDPVEMAREVAHEYGHATLPPVSGFKTPEEWGNGYLGEKLFLRALRDDLRAGKIESGDVMGASLEQLDAWVKKNADPLEAKIAKNSPEFGLMEGEGEGAMNEYVGLNLWLQRILPPKLYAQAIRDTGSTSAKDFGPGVIRTIENSPSGIVLAFPDAFKKGAWVPVGKCRVSGGEVQKRRGDWAFVVQGAGVVTLVPPKM